MDTNVSDEYTTSIFRIMEVAYSSGTWSSPWIRGGFTAQKTTHNPNSILLLYLCCTVVPEYGGDMFLRNARYTALYPRRQNSSILFIHREVICFLLRLRLTHYWPMSHFAYNDHMIVFYTCFYSFLYVHMYYICMYVCVYISIYVCMHVCLFLSVG
jgi:hypothetical protein